MTSIISSGDLENFISRQDKRSWNNVSFSVIGRLPKAKKPKAEFDACLDALMTVFSGYVVADARNWELMTPIPRLLN